MTMKWILLIHTRTDRMEKNSKCVTTVITLNNATYIHANVTVIEWCLQLAALLRQSRQRTVPLSIVLQLQFAQTITLHFVSSTWPTLGSRKAKEQEQFYMYYTDHSGVAELSCRLLQTWPMFKFPGYLSHHKGHLAKSASLLHKKYHLAGKHMCMMLNAAFFTLRLVCFYVSFASRFFIF